MNTPEYKRPNRLQVSTTACETSIKSPRILSSCFSPRSPYSPRSPLSPRPLLSSVRMDTNPNQILMELLKGALKYYPQYLQNEFPEELLPPRKRHDKMRNILWSEFLLCMLDPSQPKNGFILLMEKSFNNSDRTKENMTQDSKQLRVDEIERILQKIYRNVDTLEEKDLKGYLSKKVISVLSPEPSSEKIFVEIMNAVIKVSSQEFSTTQQYSKSKP